MNDKLKLGDKVRISASRAALYKSIFQPDSTVFRISEITATGGYRLVREDGLPSVSDNWIWNIHSLEPLSPLELLAREAQPS